MSVPEISYDVKAVAEQGELFPEVIAHDPWVAFHGTSGAREQSIEATGLEWSGDFVSKVDVERVVGVFTTIGWAGRSNGGLPVLAPFGLVHDFGEKSKKPIYLAEYSLRAHLFATRDFAGGETARALRYALRDLNEYVESASVRTEHAAGRGRLGAAPDRVQGGVDIAWLRKQLIHLASVREICERALLDHRHGVVYAVRLVKENLDDIAYDNSMGIKVWDRIAPSQLIGKVVIPPNARTPSNMPDTVRDRFLDRLADPHSLIGFLSARARAERS